MQLAHAPGSVGQPDDAPSRRTSLEADNQYKSIGGVLHKRRNVPQQQQVQQQQQPGSGAGASPWVRQVVELASQKELRAFAIEMAGATARESTRAGIEAVAESVRLPSIGTQTLGAIPVLYMALVLACMLVAYMVGARSGGMATHPL
jgi:hypothetical protein